MRPASPRRVVTAAIVVTALGLPACSSPPSPPTPTPHPSPSRSAISGPVELRPVLSVTQPGDADATELVNRLGRDVFYGDLDGNGSFTVGSDSLYVLGDAFVGAGDFVEARVVPPSGGVDRWRVDFRLSADVGGRLETATTSAVGLFPPQNQIAVVAGDRVVVAPTVDEPITSGLAKSRPLRTRRRSGSLS